MRTAINQYRLDLHKRLQIITGQVTEAIGTSVRSLTSMDADLAKSIKKNDREINNGCNAIEERCIEMLATQQLVASDLRDIISLLAIVNEMERIGDYAAGIAKTVLKMGQGVPPSYLVELQEMGDIAVDMVERSIQAYLNRDKDAALEIHESDNAMDKRYRSLQKVVMTEMKTESERLMQLTLLLRVLHNLERMGDRATNICERVIYLVTGEIKEKF
jgi:phosphate transport system protein